VKSKVQKLVVALIAAMVLVVMNAGAQLSESSGTNAVTSLAGNVQNAGNVLLPIALGVILVMSAIGVYYRFTRKAKIGT